MGDDTDTLRRIEDDGSVSVVEDYARDTSYSRSDLLPRFLNLGNIQFLRDASETEKTQEHLQELWDSLIGQGYADLQAIAENAKARRQELKHRWEAEGKAVERGDMKAEHRRYPNEVLAYLYHLDLRAGAARQMMRYIEEKDDPPEWEELNEEERERLQRWPDSLEELSEAAQDTLRGVYRWADGRPKHLWPKHKETLYGYAGEEVSSRDGWGEDNPERPQNALENQLREGGYSVPDNVEEVVKLARSTLNGD